MAENVDHFRARVLQDAMAEATAGYWSRRARDLAAVGTPRCDEAAEACRKAAAFWERYGAELVIGEVREALEGVA